MRSPCRSPNIVIDKPARTCYINIIGQANGFDHNGRGGATLKDKVKQMSYLLAGAFIYALGIVGFVRPAGLFPGGFTGLSLLIQELCVRYLGSGRPIRC